MVRAIGGFKPEEDFIPVEQPDLSGVDLTNPKIPEHIRRDLERRKQQNA